MAQATEYLKECGICHDEYDEESRYPRILSCSHCLCTKCVQLIFNNDKKCPYCRRHIKANSIKDIPINQMAMDLLKYLAQRETSTKSLEKHLRMEMLNDLKMKFKNTEDKFNIIMKTLMSQIETEEEVYEQEMDPIRGMDAMAIEDDHAPFQITVESLRRLNDPLKKIVFNGNLFAIQNQEGGRGRRYARISITDEGRLCLHHLRQDYSPSHSNHLIEYDEVMKMTPMVDSTTPPLTFLDFAHEGGGSTLGRIFIRLSPPPTHSKRAQQFFLLCSGERGPSYAHTNILWVGRKGWSAEWVRCGDYELNNGDGGKSLVSGGVGGEDGGEYTRPWLAGTVLGGWLFWPESMSAQFVITTRDYPGQECDRCFGMVEGGEEGLQFLRDAISRYPNIEHVLIEDCGIVLFSP